jgi:hypothetical protein
MLDQLPLVSAQEATFAAATVDCATESATVDEF